MLRKITSAVTLLELLIALVLIFLVILAFSTLDLFSRGQLINTDRRVKLQNGITLAMDHMVKQMMRTVGNELVYDRHTAVDIRNISNDPALQFCFGADHSLATNWAAYKYTGNTGQQEPHYQIRYCPQCSTRPCTQCGGKRWSESEIVEVIARNIVIFNRVKPNDAGRLTSNFVTVTFTACWDPANTVLPADGSPPAGTPDNPCVTMTSNISLPSVSTN